MLRNKSIGPTVAAAFLSCALLTTTAFAEQKVRMRTMVPKSVTADEIVRSLTPVGVEEGTEVSVSAPVTFLFDSAELTPDAVELLDKIARALKSDELSNYRFLVEGHTDATGSASYNLSLSKRRAGSVLSYLVDAGIAKKRLSSIGHGEERLLEDYAPQAEQNRRVEVVRIVSN